MNERLESFRSLLEAGSPATLSTYRSDGTVLATPVWFRWREPSTFEVVIADGDAKLANLRRDPRCTLLIFESVPPFRGVEVSGVAEFVDGDLAEARAEIAGRYLGTEAGRQFAEKRVARPGVIVRVVGRIRTWDLAGILPTATR